MDHETAEDIKQHFNVVAEGLRSKTEGLRSEIRTVVEGQRATVDRLDRLEGRVEGEFEGVRSEIRSVAEGQLATVDRLGRLEGRVEGEFGEVRSQFGEVRSQFGEVRRHFNVVAEGLRSEIAIVAEAHGATNERLDRLETRMLEEFGEAKALNRLAFTDLNRRMTSQESDTATLRTRLDQVERGRRP